MLELYEGVRAHGRPEKFLKIGLSETPYPAFPGSDAINSYVHFVELFSESRYSWFPSRSTKIHDSQVFKTKIHDSYIFCNWFMIHDSASTPDLLSQTSVYFERRSICHSSSGSYWLAGRPQKDVYHGARYLRYQIGPNPCTARWNVPWYFVLAFAEV